MGASCSISAQESARYTEARSHFSASPVTASELARLREVVGLLRVQSGEGSVSGSDCGGHPDLGDLGDLSPSAAFDEIDRHHRSREAAAHALDLGPAPGETLLSRASSFDADGGDNDGSEND